MKQLRYHAVRLRWTRLLAGVGVVALCSVGSSTGCTQSDEDATPPQPFVQSEIVQLTPGAAAQAGITVVPVVRGQFRMHRDFPGTVQPNENARAEISPLVHGRVVDVYADVGQEVEAGARLARLYSSDVGNTQSSYLQAQARLHEAELAFERAKDLLEAKAVSRAEVQKREAEMKTVRAEAREARARLELLGMHDDDVEQLQRQHQVHPYVPIRSPFAGRVIARNVTKGEVVAPEDKLFEVADLSTVWVIANIPEKDIQYVQQSANKDRTAEILVSAYPQEIFQGQITRIADALDPATRTLRIRVEAPNPQRRLKPEMFATVRIQSEPDPHALAVPAPAVQRDRNEPMVFVQLDAQRFVRRPVKVGEESHEMIKVLEGLREGERVASQGAFALKTELVNQRQTGRSP